MGAHACPGTIFAAIHAAVQDGFGGLRLTVAEITPAQAGLSVTSALSNMSKAASSVDQDPPVSSLACIADAVSASKLSVSTSAGEPGESSAWALMQGHTVCEPSGFSIWTPPSP